MDLYHNPFYLLSATPQDTRERILELADECSLTLGTTECAQARLALINPRKRIEAEIAWLPGLSTETAAEILQMLQSHTPNILSHATVKQTATSAPLAYANLLATALHHLPPPSPENAAQKITDLAVAFETAAPGNITHTLNQERLLSGFPQVTDTAVEETLQARRPAYLQSIKALLNRMPPGQLVKTIHIAVDSTTSTGTRHAPVLIDDLINTYEIEAQPFFQKEEKHIDYLLGQLKTATTAGHTDETLNRLIGELCLVVQNWGNIAQAIQLSTKSRGLSHTGSIRIANKIQDTCSFLWGQHGKLKQTQSLNTLLQKTFANVVQIAEFAIQDAHALNNLQTKNHSLKQPTPITPYSIKIGFFNDPFQISADGILWKKRTTPLKEITRIRWFATVHYQSALHTKITYTILWGTASYTSELTTESKTHFKQITSRLQQTVCTRLLSQYLIGLKAGQAYPFGPVTIHDSGVTFTRKKLFTNDEQIFCPWRELHAWHEPGGFCIGKKETQKLNAFLSYISEDNIHVLELAILITLALNRSKLSNIIES